MSGLPSKFRQPPKKSLQITIFHQYTPSFGSNIGSLPPKFVHICTLHNYMRLYTTVKGAFRRGWTAGHSGGVKVYVRLSLSMGSNHGRLNRENSAIRQLSIDPVYNRKEGSKTSRRKSGPKFEQFCSSSTHVFMHIQT